MKAIKIILIIVVVLVVLSILGNLASKKLDTIQKQRESSITK